jgi:hypothetical protein
MRITDYDRLLIARPVDHGSARVTSGGAKENDWRGWAPAWAAIDRGPPVVGVAPATMPSQRDALVVRIRCLDRQIRHAATKATRKELGQQKAVAEQALHQLYRQGRPTPPAPPPKSSEEQQEHPHE